MNHRLGRRFLSALALSGLLLLGTALNSGAATETKPKYGPKDQPIAKPLSLSHEYFQNSKNPATDFWKLIPYYVGQETDRTCSVASTVMILNAARVGTPLDSEAKLISEPEILKKVKAHQWPAKVSRHPKTITLVEMVDVLKEAFAVYQIPVQDVTAIHAEDTEDATLEKFHAIFSENEASPKDLIILNYLQSGLTADADVGHVAPVGAYDPKQRRVLVLDPDREYYEPYWAPLKDVVKAMATRDSDAKKNRGLLWIKLK